MAEALKFAVLLHEGFGPTHFDVMIESSPGGELRTWRSPGWPVADGMQLTRLADHRRDYLTYEGPLSGNRGSVERIAEGECEVATRGDLAVVRFGAPVNQRWEISQRADTAIVRILPPQPLDAAI